MTTPTTTGTADPYTGRPCPHCAGPWWPWDIRGPLTFQHTYGCPIDAAEIQTQAADLDRGPSFFRRATDTEKALLEHLGYAPTQGSPLADQDPGTIARIIWIGPARRRTFPGLKIPEGTPLPHPDEPWPPPRPAPPTAGPGPEMHPTIWHR